jgi:DNA-binding NtrC family response regulator
VKQGRCRLVLADWNLPGMHGYECLDRALRSDPGVHVIVMREDYTLESALEAIRRGAADFLPKPIDQVRLRKALDDVAALYGQRRRVRALEEQLLRDLEFHGIVGKSAVMLEVFDFARKVARHYTNVLLIGPTGTGKELVARAIHQLSPVSQQKLAVCNCWAMVDTLMESQLFGHVRGSFTEATDTRPGLFEYANGGTVFLDEVGETSLAMQAKLLRVIQNREIQRVGSPEVRQINVRLIAATNRDLRAEVLAGRFREDLFYRLSSIQIQIPSLTEYLQHRVPSAAEGDAWRPLSLEEVREVHIQQVLGMCRDNRLRAAQILRIGRTSLYRYLKRDGENIRNKAKTSGAVA